MSEASTVKSGSRGRTAAALSSAQLASKPQPPGSWQGRLPAPSPEPLPAGQGSSGPVSIPPAPGAAPPATTPTGQEGHQGRVDHACPAALAGTRQGPADTSAHARAWCAHAGVCRHGPGAPRLNSRLGPCPPPSVTPVQRRRGAKLQAAGMLITGSSPGNIQSSVLGRNHE